MQSPWACLGKRVVESQRTLGESLWSLIAKYANKKWE